MKIRTDFVSNSSSSSFVLWGVSFDTDNLVEKLRGAGLVPERPDYGEDHVNEDIEEFLDNRKIPYDEYVFGYDDNFIAFGLSPTCMNDNETLKEFKVRIVDKLKSYGISVDSPSKVEFIKGVNADGYITID